MSFGHLYDQFFDSSHQVEEASVAQPLQAGTLHSIGVTLSQNAAGQNEWSVRHVNGESVAPKPGFDVGFKPTLGGPGLS